MKLSPLLVVLGLVLPMGPFLKAQEPLVPAPVADPKKEFLAEVEAVVELHDWLLLLDMADPQHLRSQISLGMSHAQYVAELLGLNYEGNTLQPDGEPLASEHLNRIRQITWKRSGHSDPNGTESMLGMVMLDDGSQLLLEVQFRRVGDSYRLTGARG